MSAARCERHGVSVEACRVRKHEHGDKGSDGRFWAAQYRCWCFGGDTNALVERVIDYYERVVYPTLAHLPERSHEWLRTVVISEHQKDADAAAWVLSLPPDEPS